VFVIGCIAWLRKAGDMMGRGRVLPHRVISAVVPCPDHSLVAWLGFEGNPMRSVDELHGVSLL
jgi:hypothetical protein